MLSSSTDIREMTVSSLSGNAGDEKNYAVLLDKLGVVYTLSGHYLQVGSLDQRRGWVLHLTATLQTIPALLEQVIPILLQEKVPFKIPLNEEVANGILSGIISYPLLGKIVCIYPDTTEDAVTLARIFLNATRNFKGPFVATDYHLGGIVFAQYGVFNPLMLVDPQGYVGEYYADAAGNLIRQEVQIPFVLPKKLEWPFDSIAKYKKTKQVKILKSKYLILSILKSDSKGRVMKAWDLSKWWQFKPCIIKEAVPFMCMDEVGRDIRDRLSWQYKLHSQLHGVIPIPKAIELFESNGNVYFAMEYIQGEHLSNIIDVNFQGRKWAVLETGTKLLLIKFLDGILTNIEQLHLQGIVHRDLSPRNFHITENHSFYFLDMELAADLKRTTPNPPFVLGTPGYISKEQINLESPSVEQDIYGVGAIMIRFFTGLSPKLFCVDHPAVLFDHLSYFIQSKELAKLMCACLSDHPNNRPSLKQVRKVIHQYRNTIHSEIPDEPAIIDLCSAEQIHSLIDRSIACLGSYKMATPEGIWFSKNQTIEKYTSNERLETSYAAGFEKGISGILYMISIAKMEGFKLDSISQMLFSNFSYLLSTRVNEDIPFEPGLYNGTAGISLFLLKALEAKLIENTPQLLNLIQKSLLIENSSLDIATGISGHGLILMQGRSILEADKVDKKLVSIVDRLILEQQQDGSWLMNRSETNVSTTKLFGFSYGIAGIIYFLLKYHARTKKETSLFSAERGLNFLINHVHKSEAAHYWNYSPTDKGMDPWLHHGNSGIILTFILAYEITGEKQYKTIAESALRQFTTPLVTPYLSLLTGAAGVGEVYLEAYRVFQNEEWLNRASDIVQLLAHIYQIQSDKSICWITDNSTLPTGDFMIGNAGINHFLMRFLNPLHLPFFIS